MIAEIFDDELLNMVAPQFTIKVTFEGEKTLPVAWLD